MYLQNKYTNWYYSIIETRRNAPASGYVETHHVIPKSLGGRNTRDNLVALLPKEHFICHLLLVRMTEGKAKMKMAYALRCMVRKNKHHQRNVTARQYDFLQRITKPIISENVTGEKNPFYGKKHSDETRLKMSEIRKQRIKDGYREGNYKPHSQKTKDLLREKNKQQFKDQRQIDMRRDWMAGKVWYYNPSTGEKNFFLKDSQPNGWLRGMGKRKEVCDGL